MNDSAKVKLTLILDQASQQGIKIAVVGGVVRDQIIGKNYQHTDYDLCVEGDALDFAEALHVTLGGDIKKYPNFRSATILIDGLNIDLVSARTEFYQKPGALPTVSWSSIDQDLPRRDFTVNAIALSLADYLSGNKNYIDVTGGISHIEKKVISIIHQKSFLDDPTRLFRAVRYEARLGFHQSELTLSSFQEALGLDVLTTISHKRIFNEIQKILEEENWLIMFMRIHELHLKIPFLPSLSFKDVIVILKSYQQSERYTEFLKLVCKQLPKTDATSLLQQLSLSRDLRVQILG
jgi:tRNA nucleotidyltransferase (CCA-adding enzyme)